MRAVHDVMAPDCHTINPIFGHKNSSREVRDHQQLRAGCRSSRCQILRQQLS